MEEPLSQNRFNALVSNQYDDPIPDTDSSDMDDSQPFAVVLSNENEVTISETSCESDEDSDESNRNRPSGNDDFVEETEPSESYSGQSNRSQPEFAADDEINIPATPSESGEEEEEMSDHASGIENDLPRMMNDTAAQRYSPASPTNVNEITMPHSNHSMMNLSPILNAIYDENVVSGSDGSQRSLHRFTIDMEINIPETPSQSESEQDVESNHSREANNSQISNNSQHSNQNAPAAFSITMSQLEDDVVSVVAATVELNAELRRHTISPDIFDDSDDIIPNSLNIAESNVARPPAIVSPDIFEEDPVNEPNESQNADEVPPVVVHDDFPFIVPGKN